MLATDTVSLGDVRVSDGGYLEAFARTARTGVQQYLGAEMGRPDLGVVNVYRDAADVFSRASLHSFAKIPVTVDHPPGGVSAANWKQVAVGTTGEEVLRDGELLKIGLKIMDASAVEAVRGGKRELSVGYTTEIVWGDGTAPDGTPFQARQTQIVADHIAIVSAGRAGAACRIGDSWAALDTRGARDPGEREQRTPPQIRDHAMKTHLVDGHPVEMSDAAIIAVSGLQKTLATAVADNLTLSTTVKAKDTAIAAKDEEIGRLKTELQTAKDSAPKPEHLDRLVADRAALVTVVKTLDSRIVTDGKTDAELRRAAVAAKHGDDFVKDASDAEIIGMFKAVAKDAKPDPLAATLAGGIQHNDSATTVGDAYASMCSNLTDGWKAASSQKAA